MWEEEEEAEDDEEEDDGLAGQLLSDLIASNKYGTSVISNVYISTIKFCICLFIV